MTNIPWKDAKIHAGVIPQQASLFPRPVVLVCRECGTGGNWYPQEARIDVGHGQCPRDHVLASRAFHVWEVYSWNGNEPQDAPMSDQAR